ncbi:hypothetical protein COO60DRAFT_1546117 [Scenedesmus sp. NREL 46B-D3]|nr:hypothetical protein COO60DRAFT_1546117 [Scenedesmus sp. NREL 46B-D3]
MRSLACRGRVTLLACLPFAAVSECFFFLTLLHAVLCGIQVVAAAAPASFSIRNCQFLHCAVQHARCTHLHACSAVFCYMCLPATIYMSL